VCGAAVGVLPAVGWLRLLGMVLLMAAVGWVPCRSSSAVVMGHCPCLHGCVDVVAGVDVGQVGRRM
jgi:hypothetical protein